MSKMRIDTLLVERGLFSSRERAKSEIMAGHILVANAVVDKAGTLVDPSKEIRIIGNALPYVSRGGLKLKKAIDCFGLFLEDMTIADIGASTGGFTDVCLMEGAKKVYAIDVGYGQLAYSLRQDSRVVVMERTNARYLNRDHFSERMDFVVTDVSFISLEKILPAAYSILKEEAHMVALIKPQFEAGKDHIGKHGVVSDAEVQRRVIEKVIHFAQETGFLYMGLDFSPVAGPKGNIEFLLYLQKKDGASVDMSQDIADRIDKVVMESQVLRK